MHFCPKSESESVGPTGPELSVILPLSVQKQISANTVLNSTTDFEPHICYHGNSKFALVTRVQCSVHQANYYELTILYTVIPIENEI